MKPYLEIGRIVSPHGVRGEMKAEVWSDSPQALFRIKQVSFFADGREGIKVLSTRAQGERLLIKLENVTTPEEANALRGKVLFASRNEIEKPQGSYFIDDLIGLSVEDFQTGHVYGTLTDVSALSGRNDVYTVKSGEKETLIPAIPEVVKKTDIENGKLLICPLEGLFDEN